MSAVSIDVGVIYDHAVHVPGSESDLIDEVRQRLIGKFGHLAPDLVSAAVHQAHAAFEYSRVRDFIPLLVERRAAKQLSGQLTEVTRAAV